MRRDGVRRDGVRRDGVRRDGVNKFHAGKNFRKIKIQMAVVNFQIVAKGWEFLFVNKIYNLCI